MSTETSVPTGRAASIARRQALSAGKTALPPSGERRAQGNRASVRLERVMEPAPEAAAPEPLPTITIKADPVLPEASICSNGSCREQARSRRAYLSKHGRGDAPTQPPSRRVRKGVLDYAPKVVESLTERGQRVTGIHTHQAASVTGIERGSGMPVSGTQSIGADSSGAWRSGPKVGHARTQSGLIVSGTLVRSKVSITGDEFAGTIRITGEADQSVEDDLTPRANGFASTQFERQADPHGHTVFGTNLGRMGRRARERRQALESTDNGLPVTGSAVGRSIRVTGDEDGACRTVTGDQYSTPTSRRVECGAPSSGWARFDPVTGAKVSVAQTWAQQKVTGVDVEHNPLVTGDARGSCTSVTGSQYQGPETIEGWCDDAAVRKARGRLVRREAFAPVTGDTPVHDTSVTGTARGAGRDITGTPYYRDEWTDAVEFAEPVAAIDQRFSVVSPQRKAQISASRNGVEKNNGRVTGSFAIGQDKITGNKEFLFRPRGIANGDGRAGHAQLTGEGRTEGRRITGDAWSQHTNVTGTEGVTAAGRNPSERTGEPKSFAGSGRFKAAAKHEDPKQLVTGMFYFSKTGAKVTLSGGAQG